MSDLKAQVWSAMNVLPRPVTRDAALAAATEILKGKAEQSQFNKWFEAHGDYVVRKLNG